ncbi:MAG: hypothetical protein K2L83_06730 [Muribaculaceae bacterium]|nr:hypothetical protein [Muribaculaceae bacterium]
MSQTPSAATGAVASPGAIGRPIANLARSEFSTSSKQHPDSGYSVFSTNVAAVGVAAVIT